MTAPDAQPPPPPVMWWSPSDPDRLSTYDDIEVMFLDLNGSLPADAERLVAEHRWTCDNDPTGAVHGGRGFTPCRNCRAAVPAAALAGTTTPTDEPTAATIEKLAGAIYACDSEPPLNARTVPERWAVYQAQARNIVWPVVAELLASTPAEETDR